MLVTVTRESAIMTQTIYVRRCDPGWAGRPGLLGVAGCGSLISPGVARRGSADPSDPGADPANPGHKQAVMRNEAFQAPTFQIQFISQQDAPGCGASKRGAAGAQRRGAGAGPPRFRAKVRTVIYNVIYALCATRCR